MKKMQSRLNNTILEGAAIPLMIVLYGIPAVLLILFGILITLGISLLLRRYRAGRASEKQEEILIKEDQPGQVKQ